MKRIFKSFKIKQNKPFLKVVEQIGKEVSKKHKKNIDDFSLEEAYQVIKKYRKHPAYRFLFKPKISTIKKSWKIFKTVKDAILILRPVYFVISKTVEKTTSKKVKQTARAYVIYKLADDLYGNSKFKKQSKRIKEKAIKKKAA